MYIGVLNYSKNLVFSHIGGKVPFEPSVTENGTHFWSWEQVYDTGIDIALSLEKESYVGTVNFNVAENSVIEANVLVDGKTVGVCYGSKNNLLGGKICVPVGVKAKEITIRLIADFQDIFLDNIEILGAYEDGTPIVWPSPKSVSEFMGYAMISDVMAATEDKDEVFAAEFLRERLCEKLGNWKNDNGVVIVIKKQISYEGERYTITNSENTVTISAASRIALLYGADTVLSFSSKKGLYIADVDDMPSQKMRGLHFGLPHRDKIEFARLVMRYILIPMRFNVVFLEFAGGMRFDRHPEISEGWLRAAKNAKEGKQPFMPHSDKVSNRSLLEKDDVKRLVGYIKELGIALVPEVQSLAHVQYITYAHPEIAEIDDTNIEIDTRGADARPENYYAHCYCPSNPKSYEIIYDIIDEIVEVTEPDGYVHMGHDEVYDIGVCPLCRGKDKSTLLADHIIAMHDYLAKKGLKMIIWADMLHPEPVTDYNTYREIDRLPRDIVLLDFIWYFHPSLDIEDYLLEKGFKVAVGNLYSSHYPRFSSRIKKKGMIGGEMSTWIITDEEIFARNGKLWDLMYLSEMLWNTEDYNESNRKTYNEIISKYVQPSVRDNIRRKHYPDGYKETRFNVNGNTDNIPSELLELCKEIKNADSIEITVNGCYDRIVFEHATLYPAPRVVWKPNTKVGEYIVYYTDGTVEPVEVCYADGVMCYKSGYAMPKHQMYYRHFGYIGTWFSDPILEGKTANGEDMTILGYVWENPYPEKEISKITYKKDEKDFCHLLLAGVRGLLS